MLRTIPEIAAPSVCPDLSGDAALVELGRHYKVLRKQMVKALKVSNKLAAKSHRLAAARAGTSVPPFTRYPERFYEQLASAEKDVGGVNEASAITFQIMDEVGALVDRILNVHPTTKRGLRVYEEISKMEIRDLGKQAFLETDYGRKLVTVFRMCLPRICSRPTYNSKRDVAAVA